MELEEIVTNDGNQCTAHQRWCQVYLYLLRGMALDSTSYSIASRAPRSPFVVATMAPLQLDIGCRIRGKGNFSKSNVGGDKTASETRGQL